MGAAYDSTNQAMRIIGIDGVKPGSVVSVGGALTNRSGSIATGGTAQQAAASNSARKYLLIQNKSTANESFWFSLDATATTDSPSVEVMPGAAFTWEGTFIPTGAVSVISATAGTKFTVKEG